MILGILIGLILVVLGIVCILDYMRWREESMLGYVYHKILMTILLIAGVVSFLGGIVFLIYTLLTFAK